MAACPPSCLRVFSSRGRYQNGFPQPLNPRVFSQGHRFASSEAKPSKSTLSSDSFARGLFLGELRSSRVLPYPLDKVVGGDMKDTLKMLVEPTEKFFKEVNNPALNDEKSEIPPEIMQQLKELGAFGLQVPAEYGGIGLTNTGYARLVEIVAGQDLGVAIALGAHQSIGFKGILIAGNEQQKQKYLPDLASGQKIAAFSLTEPSSGSDANSIKTRAELSADGKHWILNGSKIWISNGGIADIFTVFAQTKIDGKDKVSAFIVERGHGVTSGPPEKKMGIKASNTAEVYFDNVKVPAENLLGELGGGFKVAMNILNSGRFGMVVGMAGAMKSLIKVATEHANTRAQFGQKLKEFGMIKEKIAQMNTKAYVTEAMGYMISSNMDLGVTDLHIEAAIGKVYGSESAWNVCDETIQILGGMGYMKGTGLERVMRDLRIFRIFEGANEILRLLVALTGIQTAGERLKGLQSALKNPLGNASVLFNEGLKKAQHAIGSGLPTLPSYNPALNPAVRILEKQTANFGAAVEASLIRYGKGIQNEQLVLRQIANCAIDLYGLAAAISRADRALTLGLPTAQHEILLVTVFSQEVADRLSDTISMIHRDISKSSTKYHNIQQLANQIFDGNGYLPTSPVGF